MSKRTDPDRPRINIDWEVPKFYALCSVKKNSIDSTRATLNKLNLIFFHCFGYTLHYLMDYIYLIVDKLYV